MILLRARRPGRRVTPAAPAITRPAYTWGAATGPIATPAFVAGDMLLIAHGSYDFAAVPTPSGYTPGPRRNQQSPNGQGMIFWKIATGGETYPLTSDGLHYMGVYRGAAGIAFDDVLHVDLDATGTTVDMPAYAAAPAGSWIARLFVSGSTKIEADMDAVNGALIPVLAKRFGSLASGAFGDSNGPLSDVAQTTTTTANGSQPKIKMTVAILRA